MPIDIEKNFIYLHSAKTGGTSIAHYLEWDKIEEKNKCKYLMGFEPTEKKIFLGTLPISYFEKYINISRPIKSFNKLIICRNPYDRCVSNFIWTKKRIEKTTIKNANKKNIKLFNNFLKLSYKLLSTLSIDELISGIVDKNKMQLNHLIPQYKYIEYDGLTANDFKIIRIENLNDELYDYFYKININFEEKNLNLMHNKMQMDKLNYKLFYDCNNKNNEIKILCKENIELVNKMYKKDFEIFNYNIISCY